MASSPIRKRLSDSDSDPPVKRLRGAQAEGETTSGRSYITQDTFEKAMADRMFGKTT